MLQKLEDFNQFCKTFDIRTVISAADQRGLVPGYEKKLYAIAILRAVQHGDFGSNPDLKTEAVSALWTADAESPLIVRAPPHRCPCR